MNETPPTPPNDKNPEAPHPRRLLRSNSDRMLTGVAGGLAEYFDVDPVLIRIGFAITGLMGIGILAYLALFIFVPEDDGWGNPVQARDRDRLIAGGIIGLLLIGIPGGLFPIASLDWWWGVSAVLFWLAVLAGFGYGIYWLLSGGNRTRGGRTSGPGKAEPQPSSEAAPPSSIAAAPSSSTTSGGDTSLGRALLMIALGAGLVIFSLGLAFTSAWGAAVGGAGFIAVLVILCGLLLAFAAFKRPMRWLVVPALALALPAAAVQASGFELEGGYGDRVIRPTRIADIPADGYRMAAGDMTIDLRQVDWRPDSTVELPARLNFGRISVIVPENVCVASDIDVWAGGFEVLGESDSDYRVQYRRTLPEKATPQLNLDGQVDIGWVEVLTRMPEDHRDHHGLVDPEATQPAHCLQEDRSAPQAAQPNKRDRSGQSAPSRSARNDSERSGRSAGETRGAGR